jgi:hypothetical protein
LLTDANRDCARDARHGDRAGMVIMRSISKLTMIVRAPTPHRSVGHSRTRVHRSRCDLFGAVDTRNLLGDC